MVVPTNIDTELLKVLYNQGARIISNSWGSDSKVNYYDSQAEQVDTFVYNNPDALVIFANGNAGVDKTTFNAIYGSVGAPSTCKV